MSAAKASVNTLSIIGPTDTPRVVEFDDKNKSLFLILNIIAHDPIHDYGSTSNKSRWNKNTNIVKNFSPGRLTTTAGFKGGIINTPNFSVC